MHAHCSSRTVRSLERDVKFGRDGTFNSKVRAHFVCLSLPLFGYGGVALSTLCARERSRRKPRHRFSGRSRAVSRGTRIRFASRGIRWKCRGFAIRYSLLTSRPSSSRRPFAVPHDSRMCFVCTAACNVWAPRYLSYGCGRRSRTGCTLHSTLPPARRAA